MLTEIERHSCKQNGCTLITKHMITQTKIHTFTPAHSYMCIHMQTLHTQVSMDTQTHIHSNTYTKSLIIPVLGSLCVWNKMPSPSVSTSPPFSGGFGDDQYQWESVTPFWSGSSPNRTISWCFWGLTEGYLCPGHCLGTRTAFSPRKLLPHPFPLHCIFLTK